MAVELPPGYYCDNFVELITHVYTHYHDLLLPAERQFYTKFRSLSDDAKKLYVRMLIRKGEVFRALKLCHYTEIEDCEAAAVELATCEFLVVNPDLKITHVLGLFNRQEWMRALDRANFDTRELKRAKRSELDVALKKLFSRYCECPLEETIYQVRHQDVFTTYTLLFFGNLHQDLSEFVLRDLGIYRYAKVAIDAHLRLFQTREQIHKHLAYYEQVSALDEILQAQDQDIIAFQSALPTPGDDDPALKRRVNRTRFKLGRELERRGQLEAAASVYTEIDTPDGRERLARVLAKLDKVEQSLSLCKQILQQPHSESEVFFAEGFAERLAKKHNRQWPKNKKYQVPLETLALPQEASVERAVAAHLSHHGECFYSENAVFSSFFGLVYWDLIFCPYRGAFTHPFQMLPHDLYEHSFLPSRQTLLGKQCTEVPSIEAMKARVTRCWQEHLYTASPFVYWNALNEELIDVFCERIPLPHWQAIFTRIWSDLRENRSGFPDLCFFPADGDYQLIEVKGPGDRLQKNQLRWMHYFAEQGIPHKVIHLEWI